MRVEKSIMSQAVAAYREIVESDEFKEVMRLRERAQREEEALLAHARREEREKCQDIIAKKDAMLAEKDALIAEKDVLIARLQAQLKEEK